MSDTWNDIQAIKNRHNTLRAKMMVRRKQRADIVAGLSSTTGAPSIVPATVQPPIIEQPTMPGLPKANPTTPVIPARLEQMKEAVKVTADPEVEKKLLMVLCDISLDIPSDSKVITEHTSRLMEREVDLQVIEGLLKKFAAQKLISIKFTEGVDGLIVNSLDLTKLSAMTKGQSKKRKRDSDDEEEEELGSKQIKTVPGPETGDIESLLSMQSTKEREEKKLNEEIQALLVTQTAKEQYLVEKFKSRGGPQLQEFCQYGTREECQRTGPEGANCKRLHFKKIIHKHTDESLGDCSFLNTCFHMDTCKDTSVMAAASLAGTTHQQMQSGSVQQHSIQNWYYDYENTSISSSFSGHRQGPLVNRSYPQIPDANSAISEASNISPGPYLPAPIQDTSHIPGRPFSSVLAPPGVDQIRHYAGDMPNTGTMPFDQNRQSSLNVGEMVVQPFSMLSSSNISADAHPVENMPVSQRSDGLGDIRNDPRPYHLLSGTDCNAVPPPSLISEMPPASAFPYAPIPYSLTAPPPAPAATAITSPSCTQIDDLPSYDTAAPVISYSWTHSGDLFSNTVPPVETKSLPKTVKPTSVVSSGKKRVRRPELWKKNVTKSKKLKGEEHVSRTGNVIPAKRVGDVDCSSCTFKCHENFTRGLRMQLFEVFYSLGSNESQKQFVCQNVQEAATRITGPSKKEGAVENKRKVCRKYFLPDTDNTRKQVCSKFFCRTLAVGKTFITHALRNKQFGCYVGREKRGKPHNKIPDRLLEPARQHISAMLAGSAGGSKKKKKCLERGLNITKMHELYKQECTEKNITPVSLNVTAVEHVASFPDPSTPFIQSIDVSSLCDIQLSRSHFDDMFVHYEIDYPSQKLPSTDLMKKEASLGKLTSEHCNDSSVQMFPPQWIQCDLRYFDMSTLGKCAVVMADPPWDIHMELPYGTMGDDEMRRLDIPGLQDDGFIFLWVTGRAMELGRECLKLWGYKRVDEIIWVKTNQLQRIIRTGRTGHWINHGKEHCLVGVKGNPKGVNKGMDCDVIVAEVRATSHKPDEIYGIIERLSPGTRKVELFGRPHNVQPNWITLGNQLEGVRLKDPDIVKLFREKYPDGNCMDPPKGR